MSEYPEVAVRAQRMVSFKVISLSDKYLRGGKLLRDTARKVSQYGVFSCPYFFVFNPNTGKYGSEKNSVFGHFSHSGMQRPDLHPT